MVKTILPGPIADVDAVAVVVTGTTPLAGVECMIVLLDCGELTFPKSTAGSIGFAAEDDGDDDDDDGGTGAFPDLGLGPILVLSGDLTEYMWQKGDYMLLIAAENPSYVQG
jgi:hypothetical protein